MVYGLVWSIMVYYGLWSIMVYYGLWSIMVYGLLMAGCLWSIMVYYGLYGLWSIEGGGTRQPAPLSAGAHAPNGDSDSVTQIE